MYWVLLVATSALVESVTWTVRFTKPSNKPVVLIFFTIILSLENLPSPLTTAPPPPVLL